MSNVLNQFASPGSAQRTQEKLNELDQIVREAATWTIGDGDGSEKREKLRLLTVRIIQISK